MALMAVGSADLEQIDGQRQRYHGVRGQHVQQSHRRHGDAVVRDQARSIRAKKGEEPPGRADAVVRGLSDALEKERRPALPVAGFAHRAQRAVILLLTPPQRQADVQHRDVEQTPVLQEGVIRVNDPAVAAEERGSRTACK
jgi:hypothetical protein